MSDFKAKCIKFDFLRELAALPDPLGGFKRPASKESGEVRE